jgi:ATP-dependent DNA helicase 2 subunit 2
LTTYKTNAGKVIETHPLLPTDEQCDLMDELVDALDLDAYATRVLDEEKAARKAAEEDGENEDEEEMEDLE